MLQKIDRVQYQLPYRTNLLRTLSLFTYVDVRYHYFYVRTYIGDDPIGIKNQHPEPSTPQELFDVCTVRYLA